MTRHKHDSGCLGVEVRGVYDGVLFWECSDGTGRTSWPEDSRRGHIAREFAATFERGVKAGAARHCPGLPEYPTSAQRNGGQP